jgi:hypothetical protein
MRVVQLMRIIVSLGLASTLAACGDDDDDDMTEPDADASYPEAPCPEDTPDFRIGLEAAGREDAIVARLVDADPSPPRLYRNDWTIDFLTADGTALEDVEVSEARTFMPVHGHDGGNTPDVNALDGAGRFDFIGLNMWMSGPWQVQLTLASESAGDDYVVFNVCID